MGIARKNFHALRPLRAGFTLLEMSITIIVMAILVSFTLPSFGRVSEQTHVDAAAQYLRSIWSAERVYWLENRTFTSSLSDLSAMGLLDSKVASGNDGYFNYSLSNVGSDTFSVTAGRAGSSVWSGNMQITQDGQVSGVVTDGSYIINPPDI